MTTGTGRAPTVRARLARFVLVPLALLAALAAPVTVVGQSAPPAAEAAVAVVAADAVAAFPEGIDFSLDATAAVPIVAVELLWRPAMVETLALELPEFEPSTTLAIDHRLDLTDDVLPPGLDVRYRWRLTDADGHVTETPEQRLLWEDARFAWEATGSGLVTVFAYNDDPAFNAAVLASAEETLGRLSRRFGAELRDPVRIWVYNSAEDFTSTLAPNSEPWVVGSTYPWFGLILFVLPPGNSRELARVVPHEISHQVLYQATRNPFNGPPAWLEEGLATLSQGTGQAELWAQLQGAAAEGRLDRLRSLNGQFPYDANAARLAYAQSLSVVQYVIDTYGESGLSRLIAVFREGVTYDEAVERALGVTLDDLDEAWRLQVPAQAERQLAVLGATTDNGGSGLSAGQAWLLASGSLVMGAAALLGLFAGGRAVLRARRLEPEPDVDLPGWPNGRALDGLPGANPTTPREQRA